MRIDALVRESARTLAEAGIENSRLEARVIVGEASSTRIEAMVAHPDRELDVSSVAFARALVERRAAGAPMAYLVGHKEFWSLEFAVTSATLVPRADSETLVAAALAFASDAARPFRALDLGTGGGCLLLSFLSERPAAWGLAVDRSISALGVAAANADSLGLASRTAFVCADWSQPLAGPFDVVLANPPYIPRDEIPGLAIEVRDFEPHDALDGGPDGLDCYRRILADLPRLLSDDGMCFFEVGIGQAGDVARLAGDTGLKVAGIERDLAGIERCVRITK
ncbi:MAG: peptide chain release factor N(5)-glutamine methyltransferase [Alphaproteobacteria bacterium]|nr:peptide chain release factor N(5)-glutamine methyltransferase [Alphaproteobacteria bacterium]